MTDSSNVGFVSVSEDENTEKMEVPTEEDGTILISSLTALFPNATGLKYKNVETSAFRGVRLNNGVFSPPIDGGWGSHHFYCVFPKSDNKRKAEESDESVLAKRAVISNRKCVDLIVLGLPWSTDDQGLTDYFSKYGEVSFAQVKMNPITNKSKGFGFVRFNDITSQALCLTDRHVIDGRCCDIRLPLAKQYEMDSPSEPVITGRKIFIGRLTNEHTQEVITEYFKKFGTVIDTFIPTPFRGFAFISFENRETVEEVLKEDHVILGASVFVTPAVPKSAPGHPGAMNNSGPFSGGYGGGYNQGGGQFGGHGGYSPHMQNGWQFGDGMNGWSSPSNNGSSRFSYDNFRFRSKR